MQKKVRHGGKREQNGGKGGSTARRDRPNIQKRKIVMKKCFQSAKEKDDKLMKKFAKAQNVEKVDKKNDVKIDPCTLINHDLLQIAISGLRKLLLSVKSERKSLHDITDEDESYVYLMVALCKLPKVTEDLHLTGPTTIHVRLPHSLVTDNTDVILITKDLNRGIRQDHQNSIDHFKELLQSTGAAHLVNEIIPLRQLKVEYKEYEAKRFLANRTDVLLCDDTVFQFIPKLIAKPFYKKRRLPVQVNLKTKNLQKELLRALSVSPLFMTMKGNCSSMKVGRMCQTDKQIEENVLEAVRKVASHAPGGWNNIQGLSLKLEKTQSIPLYVKMDSLNKVKPLPPKVVFRGEPVSDTLNTMPGRCITVFPDGHITSTKLAKNKRRIAKEEKVITAKAPLKKKDKGLESTSSKKCKGKTVRSAALGSSPKEITTRQGESSDAKKGGKSAKRKTKENKKTSKAKKQKKEHDSGSNSESEEDDLEKQELLYLKQLRERKDEPGSEEEEEESDDSEVDVWGESDSDMDINRVIMTVEKDRQRYESFLLL